MQSNIKGKMIAITGGIGSGKSLALEILKSAGYNTLSSDIIVSDLYKTRKVKKMLKSIFPNAVSGIINLKVNRKEISTQVFSNDELHKKLTCAVTPLVLKEIINRAKKIDEPVFVEVPLLFECDYQTQFDGIMVITRSKQNRVESVKNRSGLTEQEILLRMQKQIDYENFDLSPYSVILNDGDLSSLKESVLSEAQKLICTV